MRLLHAIAEKREPRRYDPQSYVSAWTEKDLLHGEIVDAFVIIFRTRGCYWARSSGCSMCGYVNETSIDVIESDLKVQVDKALRRYGGEKIVKIYTSGNFFDEQEVFPDSRAMILQAFGGRAEKVIVESLPHFVRPELVREGLEECGEFEVAMGLESANDVVLRDSVNKFWGLENHRKAADIIHAQGGLVKIYLLLKPPFLTEMESIRDTVASIAAVDSFADTISINPVNVQRDTLVDKLYRRGEYRPPWLWSVVRVLETAGKTQAHLKAHATGGGTPRGAHNCGECDARFLRAVEEFSLGAREDFADILCRCRSRWETYLELQPLTFSSVDLDRFWS